MSESVEEHRAKQRATAIDALARGQAALVADDLPAAQRWLDRAHRVAGGNDTIALLLATVRLRRGHPEAAAMFEALADRHDLREAWLGLAAAQQRAGAPALAAAALNRLFAGHVMVVTPHLRAMADAIAADAGAAGWCCLDSGHRLATGPAPLLPRLELNGVAQRTWPRRLPRAGLLAVSGEQGALLGSPLRLDRLFRLDAFVEATPDGAVSGWAWHPNAPETAPELRLITADAASFPVPLLPADVEAEREADSHDRPLAQPHRFILAASDLPGSGPYRLVGPDGRDLPGSPVDPHAAARYAAAVTRAVAGAPAMASDRAALLHAPIPADFIGTHHPVRNRKPARRVSIVVPVYRGLAATRACLDSLFADGSGARIIVVDDAGPEPELATLLDHLAEAGRITLIRHVRNHGFPAAANTGIRAAGRDDVVLLNADTLVPPGWLERLRITAHASPDIGSATPLSNDATLLSYPRQQGGNPVPDVAGTIRLDRLAARAHAAAGAPLIDLPTGIGFCMYVRRDCLDQVGLLRQDVFGQGYGEENDWCLRGRHLGWRHVAAPGVFVSHIGGQSFGAARVQLLTRNLATLNRLHPGYDALIAADASGPPLAAARRRLDLARLADRRRRTPPSKASVVLITHDMGGGVQRQVEVRCAAIRAAGLLPIVLRPVLARPLLLGTGECIVDLDPDLPNLVYDVATELPALARLLAAQRPRVVELHHMLGHDQALTRLPALLGVPYEVHVHDYAWFCPRVTLVGFARRYCGEPDIAGCVACIEDTGRAIDDDTPVPELVARSARTLAGAARVIAPSGDAATRMMRHFPAIRAEPLAWDDSRPSPRRRLPPTPIRTVGVLGAIGIEKGYDVLLACARDAAARALPLRFVVIGHTTDDARLLCTGAVFVTGEYKADELGRLIEAEAVDIGFLPSIWPETWCFTLSEAWRAGLAVVAFDIGAPAERIRLHGGGTLLPLACRAPQVNEVLMR